MNALVELFAVVSLGGLAGILTIWTVDGARGIWSLLP